MSDLDLFEQQLSDQLHARDLPAELPGLADATVRRGVSVRRRRRAAWGTALAALLIVPGALWTTGHGRTTPVPTVAAPPPATAPAATVDLRGLTAGPPPRLDYVLDGVWHQADGSLVPLTAARRTDGAVSWVPYGDHLLVSRDRSIGNDGTYSIDGGPERSFPTGEGESAAVAYPGPDGSVLVPSDRALLVLDRDGDWHQYPAYATNSDIYAVPKPTRSNIWTSRSSFSGGAVFQRRSLDTDAGQQRFPQWSEVTTADPISDQLAVTDDDGCSDIVHGSTGVSRWHSCDWSFRAFSPDGRYAMATGAAGAALLDIEARSVLFQLPSEVSAETAFHFAADDSVAFVVDSPTRGLAQAVVTCEVSGACQRSTDWSEAGPLVLLDQ